MTHVVLRLVAEASEWTWRFLEDAPFRPREETVTELILTDFARRGWGRTAIYKATTGEEATSGLDWAWALETDAGWLHMLVQAKQIGGKRFGVYPELRKPDAAQQADNLIHAARMFDALPVYALYNNNVPPFGPEGSRVQMGACLRTELTRGGVASGYPWNGYSPLGVTLAHAHDVRTEIIPAPAENQRATTLNDFAMPWECLLCPAWRPSRGKLPKPSDVRELPSIAQAALTLGVYSGPADLGDRDEWETARDQLDQILEPAEWITHDLPAWASAVAEGQDPLDTEESPRAKYFMLTRSQIG